ncbi:MAG: GNAT family N-acetyltransferase [Fimbriimonadaceae bacterium]
MERAAEVFVRGFAKTRSQTFPYVVERIDGLWRMGDDPSRRLHRRTCEWVAVGDDPHRVAAIVEARETDRYAVCMMLPTGTPDASLRDSMRQIGYRLLRTEAMFVHDLASLSLSSLDDCVQRVMDDALAHQLAQAAGRRLILPHQIHEVPPNIRQYVARVTGSCVGWVSSVAVHEAAWCSNLYVMPAFRRRGLATALMMRMLIDDRDHGFASSVLLASHAGAKLYPQLGYRQMGMLYLYRRASLHSG